MNLYDAHFHLAQCGMAQVSGASCAHEKEEFLLQEKLAAGSPVRIFCLFGIHPQNPAVENAGFMETLLREKRICGIGEAGFDCYTAEFKADIMRQEEAWRVSLELASAYGVPLVIHNRKSLDRMFRDAKKLARLPAVVFHSFAFGVREALALCSHCGNVYFSFGKPLLMGNKRNIACVRELPAERLLFETDAPYQTLPGEHRTLPADIQRVYAQAAFFRKVPAEALAAEVERTFLSVFGN